jgi:hypothetical protein
MDLPQGRQGKFRPDRLPYLIADRSAAQFHRCLIAISDGLQEPLAGERITAQRERTQRRVRRQANLYPPKFDAHQVPAAHCCRAPGVPPGLPGEPVHRICHDGPSAAVIPHGQRVPGRGDPDVHRDVQGCFTCCCCHGLPVLPSSLCSNLRGGSPPNSTPTSGTSPARPSTSLPRPWPSRHTPRRPPARPVRKPDPRLHRDPGEAVLGREVLEIELFHRQPNRAGTPRVLRLQLARLFRSHTTTLEHIFE